MENPFSKDDHRTEMLSYQGAKLWNDFSKKTKKDKTEIELVDVKELQETKKGRALGFNIVTPRNAIDKNMVLNFWPPL